MSGRFVCYVLEHFNFRGRTLIPDILNFCIVSTLHCQSRLPSSLSRGGGSYFQLGGLINYSWKVGWATQLLLVQWVHVQRFLPGAPMRRGGLSVWVRLYIYLCVCRQKTRLFAVLLLENRHEIALYRSASQFIFFERCLQSRTSLLSSAMAMVSNSCTAPRGIEHYGNWVCRPTTSLRERCEHTEKMSANNADWLAQ